MQATTSALKVETERQDNVAIIRYFNPPLGYISNRGAGLVAAAIRENLADDDVRAIVLTGGSDEIFIRHADVAQIARAARGLKDKPIETTAWLDAPFPNLMALLDNAEKPVIAAINGICMGGGFEIALACTMRIVGADVAMVEPAAAPAPAPGSRPRPRPRRASESSHRIDASRARAGWVAAPVTVAAAVAPGAPAATVGTLAVPVALGARGRRPDLGPHAAEPRQP